MLSKGGVETQGKRKKGIRAVGSDKKKCPAHYLMESPAITPAGRRPKREKSRLGNSNAVVTRRTGNGKGGSEKEGEPRDGASLYSSEKASGEAPSREECLGTWGDRGRKVGLGEGGNVCRRWGPHTPCDGGTSANKVQASSRNICGTFTTPHEDDGGIHEKKKGLFLERPDMGRRIKSPTTEGRSNREGEGRWKKPRSTPLIGKGERPVGAKKSFSSRLHLGDPEGRRGGGAIPPGGAETVLSVHLLTLTKGYSAEEGGVRTTSRMVGGRAKENHTGRHPARASPRTKRGKGLNRGGGCWVA